MPTAKSNQDANYVPWKYTAQHPFVFFAPDVPNYGGIASAAEHAVLPSAVGDPTFGSVSATATSKGVSLTNTINDGLTGLVVGRRPLTDYDQIVKDWLSNGGEQMRQEFMAALATSK
jgi:putative aldouronate transport system substrate-binding protein